MPVLAMPRLSDTMEEGTILAWLKQPGEAVEVGEDLVEIETDKATMTCQAEVAGPLAVLAEEGETHPVGHPIAWIGDDAPPADAAASGDAAADAAGTADGAGSADARGLDHASAAAGRSASAAGDAPGGGTPAAGAAGSTASATPGAHEAAGTVVRASPIARRVARTLGVDLAAVAGSGPRGRVLRADVEAHADAAATPRGDAVVAPATSAGSPAGAVPSASDPRGVVTVEPLTRIQRTIAQRMVEAKTTAPEFVLEVDVDMTAAVALRAQLKRAAGDRPAPSYNDLIVRASALALREHPRANGSFGDDGFHLHERVNVGVAVAAEGALVVPTVLDADRKSLAQVARETRELAEKVRAGSIAPAELGGGTFTVSNLGMFGIDRFIAVLNPPQAAILAVGRMEQRPVWSDADDAFRPRPTIRLSLTCDHRILYGADAARFLGAIRERLEEPLLLAL